MYENMLNFYENLDLKYPEVAISLQEINKEYPGVVKFSIPILTPSIDNSKIVHKSFHLNRRNFDIICYFNYIMNIKIIIFIF